MGEHYCCKACGLEYNRCKCEGPSTTVPQQKPLKRKFMAKTKTKPAQKKYPATVEELQDFSLTLGTMEEIVTDLIAKHGRAATIYCEAGHNNVEVLISPAPQFCKLISLPDRALVGRVALTVGKNYAVLGQGNDGMVLIQTDDEHDNEWVPVGRVEFIQEADRG